MTVISVADLERMVGLVSSLKSRSLILSKCRPVSVIVSLIFARIGKTLLKVGKVVSRGGGVGPGSSTVEDFEQLNRSTDRWRTKTILKPNGIGGGNYGGTK